MDHTAQFVHGELDILICNLIAHLTDCPFSGGVVVDMHPVCQ